MIENDHHAAASIRKREEIKNASSTQVLLTRPVHMVLFFSTLCTADSVKQCERACVEEAFLISFYD